MVTPLETYQVRSNCFGSGVPSQHHFHTWIGKLGIELMNMMYVFSTIHICVLGVHLQYRIRGLVECFSPVCRLDWNTEQDWGRNPIFPARWCGEGSVFCDLPASEVCGGAELSTRVCTHKVSRILALLLWWVLLAHLFHFRENNSHCWWFFFFWGR